VSKPYRSGSPDAELLRCAQDDSQDPAPVLSREVFSPNVWRASKIQARAEYERFTQLALGRHPLAEPYCMQHLKKAATPDLQGNSPQ
jgi:hypothetical protein